MMYLFFGLSIYWIVFAIKFACQLDLHPEKSKFQMLVDAGREARKDLIVATIFFSVVFGPLAAVAWFFLD